MQRSIETEGISWASVNRRTKGCRFAHTGGMNRRPKNAKRKTLRTHRRGR